MQSLITLATAHCTSNTLFGVPHWARGLDFDAAAAVADECNIINFALSDIWLVVANIVQMILGFAGYLAVVMLLVGAIVYMASGGNPEGAKKAKSIISAAVAGLIISLLAVTIINFIVGLLT
ncbi:MAG: hypothetical protein WDZ81_00225 [Candidatus Saccharimonadales bacterium]